MHLVYENCWFYSVMNKESIKPVFLVGFPSALPPSSAQEDTEKNLIMQIIKTKWYKLFLKNFQLKKNLNTDFWGHDTGSVCELGLDEFLTLLIYMYAFWLLPCNGCNYYSSSLTGEGDSRSQLRY